MFYLHFSIFISYIHASSLSALSEVAGYDNVRILQGGFDAPGAGTGDRRARRIGRGGVGQLQAQQGRGRRQEWRRRSWRQSLALAWRFA